MNSRFNFSSNRFWIKLSEQLKPLNNKVFVKVGNKMYSGRVTEIRGNVANFKCDYNMYSGTYLLKDLRYRKGTERLYDLFLNNNKGYSHYIEKVDYEFEKESKGVIGIDYVVTLKLKPDSRDVKYYFYKEKGEPRCFKSSNKAVNYFKKEL